MIRIEPEGWQRDGLQRLHAMHQEAMPQWVVYRRPADYPDGFVARLWVALPEPAATVVAIYGDSLDDVRIALPDGLVRLSRFDADDPVILEVWL